MFQTFDDIADPTKGPPRVARLRAELARRKLKGFLVPRADEHQGEYVPPHAERLAWLTGFSGSAGLAVVLADRAAVFVDGRYTVADIALYAYTHVAGEAGFDLAPYPAVRDWLARVAGEPGHVAIDWRPQGG